jgi:hypothetical protein
MSNLSQQFVFTVGSATTSVSIPSTAVSPESNPLLFLSDKLKGDGYYGGGDGLHTASYTVAPNFAGTLTMQASLSTMPASNDWFDIENTGVVYDRINNVVVTTTTNYVNFTGNFVWVRTKVHRSSTLPAGGVLFVNYNH